MARLGYTRYGVQGGDWGSIISTQVALADAPHVVGLHLNMCFGAAPAGADPNAGLTDRERERVEGAASLPDRGDGLPADSGHEAADAWHRAERLARRPRGLDRREVPDLVRLRRQSRNGIHEGRTAHQHHAVLGHPDRGLVRAHLLREPPRGAFADGRAPHRGADGVRRFPEGDHLVAAGGGSKAATTSTRWTEMPKGGHFAAFEQPQLLVDDMRAFFRDLREPRR